VFDERDGHSVEQLRLLRGRHPPHDLQEGHIAQVDVAQQFVGQALAVDLDSVGRTPCDVGADGLGLAGHESSFVAL